MTPTDVADQVKKMRLHSEAAERVLTSLGRISQGLFQPELFGDEEPPRNRFDPNNIHDPIRLISHPSGILYLRRSKPIKWRGTIENLWPPLIWRERQGEKTVQLSSIPDSPFATEGCFWFDATALDRQNPAFFVDFLEQLFIIMEGDFAFLTMEQDYKRRNQVVDHSLDGSTITRYEGDELARCLPGVYWANIFGKTYVDWFGAEKLETAPSYETKKLKNESFLILCAPDPRHFQNSGYESRVSNVVNHLGRRAFFDISNRYAKCESPFNRESDSLRA